MHLCPEMHTITKITKVTTVQKTIPKITIIIIAKITKITNQGNDTDKYNKSLKEQGKGLHKCHKNTETNNYSKNNESNKLREQHWCGFAGLWFNYYFSNDDHVTGQVSFQTSQLLRWYFDPFKTCLIPGCVSLPRQYSKTYSNFFGN